MKRLLNTVILTFLFFAAASWFSCILYQQSAAAGLSQVRPESASFREQHIGERRLQMFRELEEQSQLRMGELLTIAGQAASGNAWLERADSAESYLKWKYVLLKYNGAAYERLCAAYGAIWNDVQRFPVAAAGVFFENSWMFERNYGGKRGHEGTDLMPPENIPGHYPVVSMTDGVVEKIGWLEKGGYRIGIRSPSGGYFYYAHLSSYSEAFAPGDEVTAGTLLGTMGDTGYGPEGTRGQFDVHLHLGIYIRTADTEELSVNPYWVLRYADMLQ